MATMARSRNIKPGFFTNEVLAELPYEVRLMFIGLWMIADREGRLEDRPKRIKIEIFPADNFDVEAGLVSLSERGFIKRYKTTTGLSAIQIVNWSKHQQPHFKERASLIPAEGETGVSATTASAQNPVSAPVQAPVLPGSSRADSLIPDRGFSDSGAPTVATRLAENRKPAKTTCCSCLKTAVRNVNGGSYCEEHARDRERFEASRRAAA